jgi:hypothetical protein
MGYNYYPIEIGTYRVYNVTEISHFDGTAQNAIHDTDHYQIKEYLESEFIDGEGRTSIRIERYRRDSANHPWVISDVWWAHRGASRLEQNEENEKFIKLVFQVDKGDVWDGNAENSRTRQDYETLDKDVPYALNGFSFDSTITILQNDFRDGVLFHEFEYEIYARNVGMIKKYYKNFNLETPDTLNPDTGSELFMDLIEYGVE